ncbi:MAG: hypothetical protein ACJAXI_002217 [Crocinitomicaceae bacterium]|jgi:hypothetical protein
MNSAFFSAFTFCFPTFHLLFALYFSQDQKPVIGGWELRNPIFRNKSAVDFEAYPFIILNDQKSLTQKKWREKKFTPFRI